MLFNSFGFLFIFFPITVIGFFLLASRNQALATIWIGLSSLFFYGWWDYHYIPLLLSSITLNYWTSWKISTANPSRKRHWLILAISANLALLGYYKYAGFFISSTSSLTGIHLDTSNIVLPIGISFFTFTQLAFLVDTYQGKVNERRFTHYLLFVTYFPHLIAGPVLHHKEMMPQFRDERNYRPKLSNFVIGMAFFFIGLAKKVLIADNLSPYAGDLFGQSSQPSLIAAWGGVLAYTFQLYFDFSGYSDMAIGLSRVFGVKLPINFNSPYKSTNISEFWRRWHMTLSRFLRDYLYIPLGGNRKGKYRRYFNLTTTMLLGGLWHGAGWNFVIWGGLHGFYLGIHQAWCSRISRCGSPHNPGGKQYISTLITFVAVCFAWVFFRAPDISVSIEIIRGMLGLNGIYSYENSYGNFLELKANIEIWVYITLAAGLAFFSPNTQELVGKYISSSEIETVVIGLSQNGRNAISNLVLPFLLGVMAAVALMNLSRPSEFLYFNF